MNSARKYNVHNLVTVNISHAVSEFIMEQVDFQLNYFSTESEVENQYCINVLPYSDFESSDVSAKYYQSNYYNNVVYSDQSKLSVVKTTSGFDIYTDETFLINLYIQFLLEKDGYSFIHAAGVVNKEGKAVLFPASGGVGKTAIVGDLVKKHNYKLLGDDLVLINKEGKALAFPRAFILKSYHESVYPEVFNQLSLKEVKNSFFRKSIKWVIQNAPFYHSISNLLKEKGFYSKVLQSLPLPQDYIAAVPVTDIFGADVVYEHPAEIESVCYLERSTAKEFSIYDISYESVLSRIFSVIHDEWYEYIRTFFLLGATNVINLPLYYERVSANIKDAISKSKISVLSIPSEASPKDLSDYYNNL